MKKLGPLLVVVLVVFVGYWMFTEPQRFAEFTKDAASQTWALATNLFDGVISFLNALFA